MMSEKKSGNIALRIDPELHEKITRLAAADNRSVNSYITKILENDVKENSFEDRQFVGTMIPGKKINDKNGLVDVSGIYYRYLIEENQKVDKTANYVILGATGNVLTLRKLEMAN
ncbi:toxin-antitoxin system HicB family antitoxin [Oenococcus sicerae]|uniref:Toxin-antitoxin system HicB family antitoxin n=1 Tax=Oenococcus sicerae TaxID=2203724 RepID=A0AAJ1RBC5_9LACO|nr:toxin-antitoxin system HicB family antitoxin [Oenococcus sicerae]QAS70478.1 toxin-antitoxin system HicB family antitoxin [Oenococcus sicerae]